MQNHSSPRVRPRPLAAILLVILLILIGMTALVPAGMAQPAEVVKLYWGSDANPNPGNFVKGFTRKDNQGNIGETTMTNWGESAGADPYGRHMRASARYGFGGDIIPGDGEYTWVTNSKVNLTGIDRIKIMWRQTWDDDGIWRLVVSNEKNTSYTDDNVRAIAHDSKIGPYAVETMDVSDLSGEYYIRVHSRRNSWSLGAASTVRVYKLWLEPPVCYQVNTSSSPTVGGSTASDLYYPAGASGTVTATAASGYEFVNWTEDSAVVSSNANYTFTPTANRNLVANFRLAEKKIYWNGAEYFPIIGGFQDTLIGFILAKREKRSDHLYLWAEWATQGVQVAWSTDQPVDLTGINQIAVQWRNTGVNNVENESYLIAATNSSDKQENQATKIKRTQSFGTRVDRLDVSTINEPRYIRVHARDGSALWPYRSEVEIYKIWLEPPLRCQITTSSNPAEGGMTTGADFYEHGGPATVSAVAGSTYDFINWTDGGVVVSTDANYTFTVSSDRNLVANFLRKFRVTSVTPGSVVEGSVVEITDLAGAGFKNGASVKIQKPDKTVLATNVTVVSANKITCRLDLAGAPLGTYDVVVTNPDAETAILVGGFKITNACGGGAAISLSLFGVLMGFLTIAESVRFRRRRRKA